MMVLSMCVDVDLCATTIAPGRNQGLGFAGITPAHQVGYSRWARPERGGRV